MSVRQAVAEALGVEFDLLRSAAVAVESLTLGPGDVLVRRGDPAADVFVVLDGSVEVLGYDDQPLAVLESGSVVGEVAVLAGGSRTATVRSVGVTELARLDSGSFERLVSLSPVLYHRVSTEAIRRLDHRWLMEFMGWLLGPVDPHVGDAISRSVVWRRVSAGEHIYRKGDMADGGFAVIRGRIRLVGSDDGGHGTGSHEVGKGALIGEEGLVEAVGRTGSALAIRDSVVVEIPRTAFLALLETNPKVVASVFTNLMRQKTGRARSAPQEVTAVLYANRGWSDGMCRALVKELEVFGPTSLVSSERVDAILAKPGVAQSERETPGNARLNQVLAELEHENSHLVYLADPGPTSWSKRITRQADNVLIAVESNDTSENLDAVDELVAERPLGRLILVVFHPPHTERPRDTARFVTRWNPDLVVHVGESGGRRLDALARILADKATGLVLGGGGARGFAHLGVSRALKEFGIDVDMIGGASMGAAMGAVIARGGDLDDMETVVQAAFSGVLDYTIPFVSLVKGKRAARGLEAALGEWNIEDLWMPFFCTSTNLTHSRLVVHDRGDLSHALRASSSIPGVFPPVASGSDLLVDSGVLNNLPADVMRKRLHNGTVIAVDVAPPLGPRSHNDFGLYVSATQVVRSKLKRSGKRYPRMIPVMLRSMITASMRERDRSVDEGLIDLYLDLDMRGISLLDFDRSAAVMNAGYEAAAPRIEAWLELKQGSGDATT
jgi:predicted acylesterase/phospholipase RssA/CRP-like cAMP-binding protein